MNKKNIQPKNSSTRCRSKNYPEGSNYFSFLFIFNFWVQKAQLFVIFYSAEVKLRHVLQLPSTKLVYFSLITSGDWLIKSSETKLVTAVLT